MSIKKVMGYGRYVMIAVLFFYLILVWMYFKDNAVQLTSKGLLLWFVLVPLTLVFIIIIALWRQKISARKTVTPSLGKNKEQPAKQPNIYNIYIKSSLYLPEGDCWADIIANEEDLTVLSSDFSDFDGLPILTKPIAYVITDPDLHNGLMQSTIPSSLEDSFSEEYSEENLEDQVSNLDNLTQRLGTIIQQLLLSNEDTLTLLVEHFATLNYDKTHEPNSAIHIHPEWQQHYIASAADSVPENTVSTFTSQTELSFFICLPALANVDIVTTIIKQQLLSYGLLEHHYTVTTIHSENADFQPEQFINNQLVKLSESVKPEVNVLLVADSHLNESWLESSIYLDTKVNTVPTEACTLLLFSNKAAQDQLNMNVASILFTNLSELRADNIGNNLDHENASKNSQYHHFYAKNLNNIKQLLVRSSFNLSLLNEPNSKHPSQNSNETVDSEQGMATDSLLDYKITALSDINSSTQPYDLSEFMSFTDSFNGQGALVNEHHLGHYMPLNVWLKSFIALALLADLVANDQQPLEHQLLITQHNHHCMLWLADHS